MSHFRVLLWLDFQRIASGLRRPTLSGAIGWLLPLAVLGSALWLLGDLGLPATDDAEAGVALGLLVSGAISFLAYGALFSTSDQHFLRELGVSGRALFLERSLRLVAAAFGIAIALTIPYLAAGAPAMRPFGIAFASGSMSAGVASLAYAWAGRSMVRRQPGRLLRLGMDTELGRAAHLVYAPLLPFLVGAVYGGVAGGANGVPWLPMIVGIIAALGLCGISASRFAQVAPRFMPKVGEMAYAPQPREGGEEITVGRGLSGLLPRKAAAVWVRDAILAGRRFTWASRVTWPVAVVSGVALARWGSSPATQAWVIAAVGVALLVQSAAVIGMGALERDGPRWLDRLAGVRWHDRMLGRWAWAWGHSLWLLIPVGLAWTWWSGQGPAWSWPIAGAIVAAVATTASLVYAERRP